MRINNLVLILLFSLLSVAVTTGSGLSASEISDSGSSGTVIIDVRTPEEYSSGHIEGALNINYTDIGSEIINHVPDKDTNIRLYCGTGRRAGIAKKTLEDMGYRNVTNEGGYEDFKEMIRAQ